jgi:fibronectin-binding autotransporter adhesin
MRPFLILPLLAAITSAPALAAPISVSNTNGDTSSGSLGAALNNADADTANSDTITFSSLFNNPQTIDLTGPYETVSKSAGESLSLSAPAQLTISTSYGGLAFTGAGNFYLGNITIIGSTGPTNPDLSVSGGSTASLTNVSLNSIALNNGALETPVGLNTPANLTLAGTDAINVSSGQTSNFSGVISGTGTLVASGSGTLALSSVNSSYSGGTQINGGTVQVSQPFANVSPLGSGPVAINGAGTLAVTSNGFAQSGALTAGGGTLDLGSAQTVTFSALSRTAGGGLVIVPSGSTTLGSTQKVSFTTTPPLVTNGIIDASIVAANSSTDTSADFLTYTTTNGLVRATYSTATAITNGGTGGTTSTSVFQATSSTNNQVSTPTALYALKIDSGVTVGGATITLGDGTHAAGLIIDSNSSTSPTLVEAAITFATGSEGAVYVGGNVPGGPSAGLPSAVIFGPVSGTNGLTKNGNGFLDLQNARYSGATTINDGTLEFDNSSASSPGVSSSSVVNLAGTVLYQQLNTPIESTINLTSDGALGASTGSSILFQGTINGNGHALNITSAGTSGTVELQGTESNIAQYNVNMGTLQLNGTLSTANTPIYITDSADANRSTLSVAGGATVANPIFLNGGDLTGGGSSGGSAGVVTGALTVQSQFGFVVAKGGNLTLAGSIQGSGPLYFENTGSGTITISGTANPYTGQTEIIEGAVSVTGNMAASSQVNVGSAPGSTATLLGTGIVSLINLTSNGKLMPGSSNSMGTLTASGLTWNGDSTPQLQLRLSTTSNASSLLNLGSGAFTKGTGTDFTFDFLDSGETGQNYTLLTFGLNDTNFQASDFLATDLPSGLSGIFSFVDNGTTESLDVEVIPEPSTWLLLLGGLGLLFFWRIRTRRALS